MPRPPLKPVPKFHTHTSFKPLQGWGCHHCPGQLGPGWTILWVLLSLAKLRPGDLGEAEFQPSVQSAGNSSFQGIQPFVNLGEDRKIPRNSHLAPVSLAGGHCQPQITNSPCTSEFFPFLKSPDIFFTFFLFFPSFPFKNCQYFVGFFFFYWHLVQGQTILLHYHSVPPALPEHEACPLIMWVHFTWIWAWKFRAWNLLVHEKLKLRGFTFMWNLPLFFFAFLSGITGVIQTQCRGERCFFQLRKNSATELCSDTASTRGGGFGSGFVTAVPGLCTTD